MSCLAAAQSVVDVAKDSCAAPASSGPATLFNGRSALDNCA